MFSKWFSTNFSKSISSPKVELVCFQSPPHSQRLLIFCTHTKKNIHQHNLSPALHVGSGWRGKSKQNHPSIFSSTLDGEKLKSAAAVWLQRRSLLVFSTGVRCSISCQEIASRCCRWQVVCVVNNPFFALIYGKYENIMTCHTRHSFRWHVCVNARGTYTHAGLSLSENGITMVEPVLTKIHLWCGVI